MAAAVTGLCACAQQIQVVRPSAAQLQSMEPMPVVEVLSQDSLAAQDTYSFASVNVIPGAGVPIMAAAAGGALGMAIVNAEIRAEARRFAEHHVQPLRVALQGFDANGAVSGSLQQALARQPGMFGNYVVAKSLTNTSGQRVVIVSNYAMTPDFAAVQVIAKVTIGGTGADAGKPIYGNTLVYQSASLSVPAKTTADIERMVSAENHRYAALDMQGQIVKANAATTAQSPQANQLRLQVASEQLEHRRLLKQARASFWDADTRAQYLCEAWAAHQGEALKTALQASGAEIAHMLQLDLTAQVPANTSAEPRTVSSQGGRSIEYVAGGRMMSLATGDADGSNIATGRAPVTVTMPPMKGR
jgi:hypothetical protein